MIYTVTFNPSLDYMVSVDGFKLGVTNRTSEETLVPGGKGINVSMVLKNLGINSTALGYIAGFTGEYIKDTLNKQGVNTEFISLQNGISRINVKLKSVDGTEINGNGPNISKEEVEALFNRLQDLEENDVLVLAGSIPSTLADTIYEDILETLVDKGILFIVDATRDLLVNVLKYHPFLIKPNNHELGEIFNVELKTRDEVIPYAKKLQELGARNVLVSMAGEGAVLVSEKGDVFKAPAPKGTLVNGVGAGDSMVAGFLAGWMERQNYEHAFYMGVSTGSATAFKEGLATKEEVMRVYQQVVSK